MFVARVKGKSMEPLIPDGSFCLFQTHKGGGRDGRIVFVQHRDIHDAEWGGNYTLKRYAKSIKETFDDETWRHKEIHLAPINPDYETIILRDVRDEHFATIADWVEVLRRRV